MTGGPLRRREALTVLGAAAILAGGSAYLGTTGTTSASSRPGVPDAYAPGAGQKPTPVPPPPPAADVGGGGAAEETGSK